MVKEEWHDFQVRKEVVKRKGESDVVLTFYENENGVIERNNNTRPDLPDGLYLARYDLKLMTQHRR